MLMEILCRYAPFRGLPIFCVLEVQESSTVEPVTIDAIDSALIQSERGEAGWGQHAMAEQHKLSHIRLLGAKQIKLRCCEVDCDFRIPSKQVWLK